MNDTLFKLLIIGLLVLVGIWYYKTNYIDNIDNIDNNTKDKKDKNYKKQFI